MHECLDRRTLCSAPTNTLRRVLVVPEPVGGGGSGTSWRRWFRGELEEVVPGRVGGGGSGTSWRRWFRGELEEVVPGLTIGHFFDRAGGP